MLILLDNDEFKRRERYSYLEPFIAFSTDGSVSPILPQIYPGMGTGKIEKTMERRDKLFAHGVEGTLQAIAEKLNSYLPQIMTVTPETIRDYHSWYESRGKVAWLFQSAATSDVTEGER